MTRNICVNSTCQWSVEERNLYKTLSESAEIGERKCKSLTWTTRSPDMDSLERLISAAKPMPRVLAATGTSLPRRALVHASLATSAAVGRRGRHLTGTFCLTGDTMEGIIQCLVFLKAFSVSSNTCRIAV